MILNQVSVERLRFTCTGCQNTWTADYDVQHVEDGYGHDRDYYFCDGQPCPDPTAAGVTVCPGCGHGRVAVTIAARRASPAVTGARPGDRGTRPSADKTTQRAAAPLLPGTGQGAA
jgi:hypothetical protein